jgi:kumamolisin
MIPLHRVGLLLIIALALPVAAQGATGAGSPVFLPGSVNPVENLPASGPINPHKAYVSRRTLTSAETNQALHFEVALRMRNFAELEKRAARRERLSGQEMAARYDPRPADYQAVIDWLTSQGFTITRRDEHHTVVFATGTVARLQHSLQATFARVRAEGKDYTAAISAPSVPPAIGPLLIGINGLQPYIRKHKHLVKAQLRPNINSGTNSFYYPSQIAQAYQATGLYSAGITGAGQSIAIVIDTFPASADLTAFWSAAGVTQSLSNIQFIQVVPGLLPEQEGEETLDVEWSSSIAPSAKVRVYGTVNLEDTDLDTAYTQIYTDATDHPEYGIHQMSMSYGGPESGSATSSTADSATSAELDNDHQLFTKLTTAGVTVFASSGDSGSTPGAGSAGDETGVLQPENPASDPNVTGVGGTSLILDSNNVETSETVWNSSLGASGGGTSSHFSAPSWQSSYTKGSYREVPDLACTADPAHGAYLYLGGEAYGPAASGNGAYGGTSWASPTCAAFCALINQARADAGQASIGFLNPLLYPLIGTSSFRDITSGNNATSNSGGLYAAGTGYDEATGVGVPLVQALAQALVGSTSLYGVQEQPPFQNITPGQSATFTVTAGGSPASYQWQREPAGTASYTNLSDGGSYSGSASATLTVSIATPAMSGDQFQCVVSYGTASLTSTSSVLSVEVPYAVTTLAGKAGVPGRTNGSVSPPVPAEFDIPSGVALDGLGNLYVADYSNNSIRKINLSTGAVTTPYGSTAGTAGNRNANGNSARFDGPNSVAAYTSNNVVYLYVADTLNSAVREINTSSGAVITIASSAGFLRPDGVAVDGSGDVFVADTGNNIIREISSSGTVSTLAGTSGTAGYFDAIGTAAEFNVPTGVTVDGSGNVYVSDYSNCVIRKITSSGAVTTVAGQPGVAGYLDGPASQALFNTPSGVAVDSAGNLYVADSLTPSYEDTSNDTLVVTNASGNDVVRKISPANVVSTLAGLPGGDGTSNGTGTAAQFYSLQSLTLNSTGTLYLVDSFNQTIRSASSETLASVSATQPAASTFGPVAGQFTVTRFGNTSASLTVPYTVGGTAVAGTDYTTLAGTLTIPAGSSSAAITVNPLYNSQPSGTKTVILTLSTSSAYVLTNPTAATVTITEPDTYQSWKLTNFGSNAYVSSIGGDLADPNHNGVPNLLEYAFDSNPLQAGTNPLPVQSTYTDGNGNNYVEITYTQINNDPNLTCTVQVTSDLTQQTDQWHSGPSYTTVVSQQTSGNTTTLTVRDNTPTATTPRFERFIRVQVAGF